DVLEQKDLAVLFGQLISGLLDCLAKLGVEGFLVGAAAPVALGVVEEAAPLVEVGALDLFFGVLANLGMAQPHQRVVGGDAVNPGAERGVAAEVVEVLE